MPHDLPSEIASIEKAAIEQGIRDAQPGQPLVIDLSDSDIYLHLAGVGCNVLSIVVERPVEP
jgi:hypothetical protein